MSESPGARFLAVESLSPLRLSEPLVARHQDPRAYHPPQGLREAIEVALLLGEPLVLTGQPGSGKTQAAYWLAHILGAGRVERFDVKSTTAGNDLLYTFDEVGRFRDAAAGYARPLVDYIRFNALGMGILRALGPKARLRSSDGRVIAGPEAMARNSALLHRIFIGEAKDGSPLPHPPWEERTRVFERGAACIADLLPHDRRFRDAWPTSAVVLIDELDKAPRDTPNDLLAEVERMEFAIPELGLIIRRRRDDDDARRWPDDEYDGQWGSGRSDAPDDGHLVRPIVLITSNAEKGLPEPFLRRCAYFDVPFPQDAILREILSGSLSDMLPGPLVEDAVTVSGLLQAEASDLDRPPGTAELMAWVEAVRSVGRLTAASSLRSWILEAPEALLTASLGVLLKTRSDINRGRDLLQQWARGGRSGPARA